MRYLIYIPCALIGIVCGMLTLIFTLNSRDAVVNTVGVTTALVSIFMDLD